MISTKGRYAIRFMIDLAEHENEFPITLNAISVRQSISKKYLESIVNILVKAKLVKGTCGKGGGYYLVRKPEDYTVYEILSITEGTLSVVPCLENDAEQCPREMQCKTVSMWRDYNHMVYDYFSKITIKDLI